MSYYGWGGSYGYGWGYYSPYYAYYPYYDRYYDHYYDDHDGHHHGGGGGNDWSDIHQSTRRGDRLAGMTNGRRTPGNYATDNIIEKNRPIPRPGPEEEMSTPELHPELELMVTIQAARQ